MLFWVSWVSKVTSFLVKLCLKFCDKVLAPFLYHILPLFNNTEQSLFVGTDTTDRCQRQTDPTYTTDCQYRQTTGHKLQTDGRRREKWNIQIWEQSWLNYTERKFLFLFHLVTLMRWVFGYKSLCEHRLFSWLHS